MRNEQNEDRLADFRANLQSARRSAGFTQVQLAEALQERGHGFQQQTVQKIENGTRTVRLDEAAAIAEVLGVGLDDLLMPPQRNYGFDLHDAFETANFALRNAVTEYVKAQAAYARYIDLIEPEFLNRDSVLETPHEVVDFALAKYAFDADEFRRMADNFAEALPNQEKYVELAHMLRDHAGDRVVGPLTAEIEKRTRGGRDGVDPEAS